MSVAETPAASITPSAPSPSPASAHSRQSPTIVSQPYCLAMAKRSASRSSPTTPTMAPCSRAIAAHSSPIGPGPRTSTRSPGLNRRIVHDRVVRHRAGLRQAGFLERQLVRHPVQTAGRHADVLGHRAVDPVAEAFARRIEVVQPLTRHRVHGVDDRRRLADDAVAFFPAGRAGADFGDRPAEFVTQDHGVIDRPAMIRRPLVQITAADADRGDLQQHVFRTDLRPLDLAELDGVALVGEIDDSRLFHGEVGRK